MRPFQLPSFLLLPLTFVLALASHVDAASLTLAWDPPSDNNTAGFTVFYGTAPGVYTTHIDVGSLTERRVDRLADGVTYYFVVRAYSSLGEFSEPSEMVSGTTPIPGGTPPPVGVTPPPGGVTPPPGGVIPPPVGGTPPPGSVTPGVPVESAISKWPGGTTGDLIANVRDNRYIDIAWVPAAGAPTGYRVEVGNAYGDTFYSALTSEHGIAFDMADAPTATYFLRVRPVMGAVYGYASEELVVSPGSPVPASDPASAVAPPAQCVAAPSSPRQFEATANGAAVALNWQRGAGDAPAGYVLDVGSAPGRRDVLIANFEAGVIGVTATATDAAYALRLAAVNQCGPSLWAPETILYVGVAPLPGKPQTLIQEVSGGLVTLTWEPPTTGGPITRYLIEATTPVGPFVYDTRSRATGFANANTPPGQYLVTVRAGNGTGFGPASQPVLVVVQ